MEQGGILDEESARRKLLYSHYPPLPKSHEIVPGYARSRLSAVLNEWIVWEPENNILNRVTNQEALEHNSSIIQEYTEHICLGKTSKFKAMAKGFV